MTQSSMVEGSGSFLMVTGWRSRSFTGNLPVLAPGGRLLLGGEEDPGEGAGAPAGTIFSLAS